MDYILFYKLDLDDHNNYLYIDLYMKFYIYELYILLKLHNILLYHF